MIISDYDDDIWARVLVRAFNSDCQYGTHEETGLVVYLALTTAPRRTRCVADGKGRVTVAKQCSRCSTAVPHDKLPRQNSLIGKCRRRLAEVSREAHLPLRKPRRSVISNRYCLVILGYYLGVLTSMINESQFISSLMKVIFLLVFWQ